MTTFFKLFALAIAAVSISALIGLAAEAVVELATGSAMVGVVAAAATTVYVAWPLAKFLIA